MLKNIFSGKLAQYSCERHGPGKKGDVMSYGNGSTTGKGLVVPYSGKLFCATASATFIIGLAKFSVILNGKKQNVYEIELDGQADDRSKILDWSENPLTFTAGDILGWQQIEVPIKANTMNISYFIVFD